MRWSFPSNNNGDVNGISNSGVETFQGTPLKSLAREICQNSLDAALDENTVTVDFISFELSKEEIPGAEDLCDAFKRSLKFWEPKKAQDFFKAALDVMNAEKIPFLRISDYNTTGLCGSDGEYNTPWCNLTKSSGASDKAGTSGGSFGIGKYAPFACSSFRTVFYSTLDKDGKSAYQGISRITSFRNDNNEITSGVGYCGGENNSPVFNQQLVLDPAYSRPKGKTGTDVYIAGFRKSIDWKSDIVASILDGFLYAIYTGKLVVHVDDITISKEHLTELCNDYKEYLTENANNYYAINPVSVESGKGTDPVKQFLEMYTALKDSARNCLLLKAQGQTLQEIGESIGVTRERVRQIIAKTVRKLNFVNGPILEKLMQGQGCFYKSDIKKLFNVPEHLDCFAYILENSETIHYFEFADKFVDSKLIPDDWEAQLRTMMYELVGDAVNYYDILDEVEAELANRKLNFLDASDFMGFLFEQRYIAMGDYIMKRRGVYKRICYDTIRRYFKTGIKLDSDDENQDMLRMREIISREYAGYTLPDNNRAITARVSPDLILCGRGRYCAPENAVLDENLFAEIVEYINNSEETSLYYAEIFAAFSGRLIAETSVDNANYLHGALRYLYPDDFEYERDLLVKHGMLRVTFGERLVNAIKSNGGPIAKKELLKQFPGVTDIRIVNAIVADPKLIQWDYNEFNHIDNVHCTDSDADQLHIILDELLNIQGGYSSENNFYSAVKNKYPGFLEKNKIESSLNLFYIAAYLFSKDYRFSRPHIASQAFPDMELTNINVARFFVADRPELYYQEFVQISQRAGWSNGTFTIILNAIEKDYIRVDLNRYIHRSLFSVTPDAIEATRHQLENLVHDSGYYGIFAIFSYDGFPAIDYEWNEHLLQSIIENYDMGFRLLEPKVKDRR